MKQLKIVVSEQLNNAGVGRKACIECGLHENQYCNTPFLKPYVPADWNKKFLFVGEASESFERNQSPFLDLAGSILKDVLKQANLTRQDIAFYPVLRCRNKKPSMKQIRACLPFLYRVVDQLHPQYIVCMGKTALKALSNAGSPGSVTALRGHMGNFNATDGPIPILYTYGLSEVKSDPNAALFMREDFERVQKAPLYFPKKAVPKESKYIGFDTEYSPTKVLCGAFSSESSSITLPASQLQHSRVLLEDSIIVGHNLPVDLDSLLRANVRGLERPLERWLQGFKQRDSLLVARLANENRGKGAYKLDNLLLTQYNVNAGSQTHTEASWKAKTEEIGIDPEKWPKELCDERCRIDAWATLKVYDAFKDQAKGPIQMVHQIAMTLHRIRLTGVYVDWKQYCKTKKEVYREANETEAKFKRIAHKHGLKDFDPNKDADIRKLVYDKMGLEAESYTEGGLPSTSVKVLKEFEEDNPEIQALISYSKAEKLRSTYCDSLEAKFVRLKDGLWLPVNINPLAAKTGRRASSGPNMQNLPTRIRKIFVSRFRGGSISDNDYSKLEPIIGGWVTGELRLTEYFLKYPNGYIKIGEDFFKKTVEKNTKEYTMMKSLVLAIIYNKKKWSLAEDLWVNYGVKLSQNYEKHIEESGIILERFLNQLFPKVRRYHMDQEQKVLSLGYVDNVLEQRRRLPLPPEPSRKNKFEYKQYMRYKAHVINQAINYPIQSLAAYVTGSALIDLERVYLEEFNWKYVDYHKALLAKEWPQMPLICIEVHDDLVQDVPHGMEKRAKNITQEVMAQIPTLRKLLPDFTVPLKIDTNIGERWGLKT